MKKTLAQITPALIIFLTPLFFLPFTTDFFQTNKLLFIVVSTFVALIGVGFSLIKKESHSFIPNHLTWPLAVFWLITIVNLALTPEARYESLTDTGALFLSLPLLTLILTQLIATRNAETKNQVTRLALGGFITAASVLSLLSIAQVSFIANLSSMPAWLQNIGFTPTGSILSSLIFQSLAAITAIIWGLKLKKTIHQVTLFLTAGLNISSVLVYLSLIIRGKRIALTILPLQAGWSIALDGLKSIRQLLVGAGLANFSPLYTQFKPSQLAQTNLWTAVFTRSSTEILHLLSTMGIVGLGAFLLLIIAVGKIMKDLKEDKTATATALRGGLGMLILSFMVLPANIISYTLFFILAGLAAGRVAQPTKERGVTLPHYVRYSLASLLGIMVLVSGYYSFRAYAAERAIFKAQQALAKNDVNRVYQESREAIRLAPNKTRYHLSFARLNLQLANSMAQTNIRNEQATNQGLSEQDQEQIVTLIQRAIEQGRIATELRPRYFLTWQTLGSTYRNLINVVQQAETFALQNLQQAVQLSPTDPSLRIELGGLFYQLALLRRNQAQDQDLPGAKTDQARIDPESIDNLLEQAVQQFQLAVKLRPNYANGYYNLAKAHEARGNYRSAYQAMQLVLANLQPDSADYQLAQEELLSLEDLLPQTQEANSNQTNKPDAQIQKGELEEPLPLPTPLPGGPLDLPESTLDSESTQDSEDVQENPLRELNQNPETNSNEANGLQDNLQDTNDLDE